MIIRFNYPNGFMEVDADALIQSMRLVIYKRYAPLFAKYGTSEQHNEFLQLLDEYIENQNKKFNEVASASPLIISHVKGAFNELKRYKTMRDVLKGLVS